jgi:hypothetical protein
MVAAGRTPKMVAGMRRPGSSLALASPFWELGRRRWSFSTHARILSLIEINLRWFRFVVTFTRVRACQ